MAEKKEVPPVIIPAEPRLSVASRDVMIASEVVRVRISERDAAAIVLQEAEARLAEARTSLQVARQAWEMEADRLVGV